MSSRNHNKIPVKTLAGVSVPQTIYDNKILPVMKALGHMSLSEYLRYAANLTFEKTFKIKK